MGPNDIVALKASYEQRLPVAREFCERLMEEVLRAVTGATVQLAAPIDGRVKHIDSILAKVGRQGRTVRDVMAVNDLVGVRLVLMFPSDIALAKDVIGASFAVSEANDVAQRLGEREFGYQSLHLLVRMPDSWQAVPSFRSFGDFTAEIQVRTASQHVWAAASHILQYKHEYSVPKPLRRTLSRVAALLECVDSELERVRSERSAYIAQLEDTSADFPLDVDTVRSLLNRFFPHRGGKVGEEEFILDLLLANSITHRNQMERLMARGLGRALADDAKIIEALKAASIGVSSDTINADINGRRYWAKREAIERGEYFTREGLVINILRDRKQRKDARS